MMGLTIDPEFATNRFIYTCFASTDNDVRIVALAPECRPHSFRRPNGHL